MNAPILETRPVEAAHRKARVLFFAEAVTLAHVARPFVLAASLDPDLYEVYWAANSRYNDLLGPMAFAGQRSLDSIPCEQFLGALAKGAPVYDAAALRRYVVQDLALIRDLAPDLIVGDFRLSLSVSARVAGVPYWAIANAYWSPYARQRFPLPDLPMNRFLGLTVAGALFRMTRPLAFAFHTLPLNRVRREYGLPSLGLDLRRIYTDSDYTLYADVPELVPTFDRPDNHVYLGPVLWSPSISLPDWWGDVPDDRPTVYVNLGSSGPEGLLDTVLAGLAEMPVSVIAATAGRRLKSNSHPNVWTTAHLPGEQAVARSALVICNGGSPSTHQALAVGKPVLGIASNLDQFLNMQTVRDFGAGEILRAGKTCAAAIRAQVGRMISQASFLRTSERIADLFARYPARLRFGEAVGKTFSGRLSPAD